MSAPPDLGAHSISWCIAPARDYAALSGAEEEMFRETDVAVRPTRLSLLFAERITSLIGGSRRAAPPPGQRQMGIRIC